MRNTSRPLAKREGRGRQGGDARGSQDRRRAALGRTVLHEERSHADASRSDRILDPRGSKCAHGHGASNAPAHARCRRSSVAGSAPACAAPRDPHSHAFPLRHATNPAPSPRRATRNSSRKRRCRCRIARRIQRCQRRRAPTPRSAPTYTFLPAVLNAGSTFAIFPLLSQEKRRGIRKMNWNLKFTFPLKARQLDFES